MSVVDTNKIDGIAISKDGKKLMLLISDHLDWSNEYEHLIELQNKINSYVGFLENQQYREIYPNKLFSAYCIEIHFLYETTANCVKLINAVNKQLAEQTISIEVSIEKPNND